MERKFNQRRSNGASEVIHVRNARNIIRHELVGLECTVVKSANRAQTGIHGTVEDETMKTLVIGGKRVFKKGSVFRLKVNDQTVEIEGGFLVSRPEDRIKKKIRKW